MITNYNKKDYMNLKLNNLINNYSNLAMLF